MAPMVGDIYVQSPTWEYHYSSENGEISEVVKLPGEIVESKERLLSYATADGKPVNKNIYAITKGAVDYIHPKANIETGQLLVKIRSVSVSGVYQPRVPNDIEQISVNDRYWFCYENNLYPIDVNYRSEQQAFITISSVKVDVLPLSQTLPNIVLSREYSKSLCL